MKYVELRRVNTDETFVDLPNYTNVTFDSTRNCSPSVINLTYPFAESVALGLQAGAFISVLPDGVEIPDRYVLEQRQKISVTDDALVVTWSGRSLKAIMEDDFVWPSAWPNPVPQGHEFVDASAGTIMKTFLTRSQARGFITSLTHSTFTGVTDSSGASWLTLTDKNFSNGASVLSVAENLYDMGMIEMRTNKFALEMYRPDGLNRHLTIDQVCFTAGKNIADESTQEDSASFYTDVLMEGEQAAKTATDPSVYTKVGRRRARYSQAGGIADAGTLQLLANTDLAQYSHIQTERSLAVSHQEGEAQPFSTYRVGDWVWLDVDGTPVEIQVQQIAVSVQRGAIPQVSVTLGDLLDSVEEKLKRRIDAITGSNAGSYGPIPGTTGLLDLTPAAPTGLGTSYGVYTDSRGINRVAVTLSWNEVSTNADGTSAFDIASYEAYMRDDSGTAAWQLIGRSPSGTPVSFFSPLPENTWKRYKVIAIDNGGKRSASSAELRTLTSRDTVGPVAPSTPTVSARLSTVSATWNGLNSGGTGMDADFSYVEVHKSQTSGFTPSAGTRQDRLYGAGSVVVTGLAVGTTWYFKFLPVDVSGNPGTVSAQSAPIAITAVVSAELAQSIRDQLDAALAGTDLLNSWTFPGTTNFDGGKVQTNSLLANAIAARTIGTDKLLVGGVTNVAPNGAGEWGSIGGIFPPATVGVSFETTDKPTGLNGVFKTSAGTSTKNTDALNSWWDVEPGQQFLVEVWLKANSANSRLSFDFHDQSESANAVLVSASTTTTESLGGSGQYPINDLVVPTTWTKYSCVATVLPGVTKLRVGSIFFNKSTGSNTTAVQSIAIRVRAKNSGKLVVDGTIDTNLLAANAVKTANLDAGAVNAEKLALGVRGNNLIADPSFEDLQPIVSPTLLSTTPSDSTWTSVGGSASLRRFRGRTGAWSVSLYNSTVDMFADSRISSNLMQVIPGETYKFAFYAVGSTDTVAPYYTILGGATETTVVTPQTLLPDFDTEPVPIVATSLSPTDPTEYTLYSFDYTVPAGITFCRVYLGNSHPTGPGSLIVDDVSLILKGSTSTEVTPAGVRLFDTEGLEVGAFVSNRPNYFSVTRQGMLVAAIGDEGDGVLRTLAIAGTGATTPYGDAYGLTIGGDDLADLLVQKTWGFAGLADAPPNTDWGPIGTDEVGLFEMSFIAESGRHFEISASNILFDTNGSNSQVAFRLRHTQDGTAPKVTSALISEARVTDNYGNGQDSTMPHMAAQIYPVYYGSPVEQFRVLLSAVVLASGSAGAGAGRAVVHSYSGYNVPRLMARDMGRFTASSYVNNKGGGAWASGTVSSPPPTPPASPPSKTKFTSYWRANSSESYGNFGARAESNLFQGYYSSNQGHQHASILFTAANSTGSETNKTIGQALTGATVREVWLYIRNADSYSNAGGTAVIRGQSSTSLITSAPSGSWLNVPFKKGEGKWVDITAVANASTRGVTLGRAANTSKTYYTQWLNHAVSSGAPSLKIVYDK